MISWISLAAGKSGPVASTPAGAASPSARTATPRRRALAAGRRAAAIGGVDGAVSRVLDTGTEHRVARVLAMVRGAVGGGLVPGMDDGGSAPRHGNLEAGSSWIAGNVSIWRSDQGGGGRAGAGRHPSPAGQPGRLPELIAGRAWRFAATPAGM